MWELAFGLGNSWILIFLIERREKDKKRNRFKEHVELNLNLERLGEVPIWVRSQEKTLQI